LLTRLNSFGWIGVDIFLALSSYLIFSLLMEEKRVSGTISIERFYIRRALRIWPLYFPFLLIAFFLIPLLVMPFRDLKPALAQHLLPFLTFTGNLSYALFPKTLGFFAHLWTISLEEQFYFVAPVFVFFGSTLRPHAWRLGLLVLAFAAGARWYVMGNAVPYPTVWVFTLCRLDPFVVGAGCALLLREHPAFACLPLGWLFLLLALGGFWAVTSAPQIGTSIQSVWQLTVTALASGALLLGVLLRFGGARVLSLMGLPFLGKISYGIYVYHELALLVIGLYAGWLLKDIAGGARWAATLSLVTALTVAMAAASYLMWERRFLRFKIRFERIPSRPA
jgi:peptidoglycan/LPS O-acetylase OafA/YrhL